MKTRLKDWHKTFFRTPVFSPGRPEVLAQAPKEAAFVLRALGLKRRQAVLDVCCGTGRHSLLLAERGLKVTGLDVTAEYLREARWRAQGADNPVFVRGDMRRLPYREEFDAAINLWTSFGYFPKLADDLRVLKGVARALKPGGRFLIDIIDGAWLKRNFIPRNWRRRSDGTYLLEEAKMLGGKDPAHTNTWTVIGRGRRRAKATFFVRNYDYSRLSKALRQAGLVPVRRWGGLDGKPCTGESPRLVVLARKPLRS